MACFPTGIFSGQLWPLHMCTCVQVYRVWLCRNVVVARGSLHTSQISHLLLYPSLWLLVPGLSSQFCHYFLYNLFLMSAVVAEIFEKWLQDFVSFGNPWWLRFTIVIQVICTLYIPGPGWIIGVWNCPGLMNQFCWWIGSFVLIPLDIKMFVSNGTGNRLPHSILLPSI